MGDIVLVVSNLFYIFDHVSFQGYVEELESAW